MVWDGINIETCTDLLFINRESLTADQYITEILEDHLVPFAPVNQDNFLLLHDNAHPQVAGCVTKYLGEVGIQRMVWPARSPDINPIELVWYMLGRSVRIHFCENL